MGLAVIFEHMIKGDLVEICVKRIAERANVGESTVWHSIGPTRRALKKAAEREDQFVKAMIFLSLALYNGPRPEKEVTRFATQLGISRSTLRRASEALEIRHRRIGGRNGHVEWDMPDDTPTDISANS
jgi:hypothetical protein